MQKKTKKNSNRADEKKKNVDGSKTQKTLMTNFNDEILTAHR